ncbi:MAG: Sec-independent protein translocase protein TatB [Candidatus Nanopelagicales bacterium]
MFDIGLGELLVLGLLALLVFGPDRLPQAAASAGRFVAKARETVGQARAQISESAELNSVSEELQSLADLHPKRMLSSLAEPAPGPGKAAPVQPAASPVDPNAT